MKKIYIFLLILFFVFPNVTLAKNYTQAEIDAREKGYDAETGLTYVKEGQPILTDPQSNTSNEAFEYNGKIYPKNTPMLTIDADGNTGNVTEGQHITHDHNNVNGSEDNTLRFNGKGEMVYAYIETDGNTVYTTPTIKVKIYTDKIYTTQDTIDRLNNNDTFREQVKMITGDDKLTFENYDQVAAKINIGELGDHMVFSGFDRADSVQYLEIVWDGTYYRAEGVIKDGIVVVDGFGQGPEHIFDYYLTNKLYSIFGDGIVDLDEWKPETDPDPDPDPDPTPDPGGGGGGGATWTSYGAVSMSANVSSDIYNVSHAIPTSENIKGTVSAKDIGWNYGINKVYKSTPYYFFEGYLCWDYGLISDDYYDESGEYHPEVWGCRQSTTATVPANYTTHYFDVAYAEMSRLSGASVSNETTGLLASAGPATTAGFLNRIGDVITDDSDMPKTISGCGGTGDYNAAFAAAKSNAEYEIKKRTYAQNDYMVIGGGVLEGITPKGEEFGDSPNGQYSTWTKPSATDLNGSGTKMIPEYKTNGWYTSTAGASYSAVPSFDGKSDSAGASPPNVFVHTPVVNKTQIIPDDFINQKVVQEGGLTYLQLDKGFTIKIPDDGTHIGAQGYCSRTYNSYQAVPKKITNWGKKKDVKVPFDAYLKQGTNMILIKANTWLSDYSNIDTTVNSFEFLIPVWSEEAKGTIETRVVAENIPIYNNGSTANTVFIQDYGNANTDSSRYIAQDKVEVEIVGKIYDLRISSTNDPGWPGIKGKEGAYITSPEFPFGQSKQNAMQQYKFAPKLGYVVEFDFKTKGVKTDNVDVDIQPEGFYFVGKNGESAQEVDLYFKTTTNQYVKIDAGTNNSDIIVNLSNPFMKVAKNELIDSGRIMRQQIGVLYTYAENVLIGKLPNLNIPEKLRLCYNNFAEYVGTGGLYKKSEAEISQELAANGLGLSYSTNKYDKVAKGRDTVIASVGHWYAGYRLPSSTIAVPKGTTVNQIIKNPNIAKKNGYILVKFDIVGKNGAEDYLRYTGPESITEPGKYEDGKKWQDPSGNPDPINPNQPVQLPNEKPETIPDGIVIMFETDFKANNDYEVIGTH